MPTVEQLKKVASRTVAQQASEKILYNRENAFNMKNIGFTAMVQGLNEYFVRDQIQPLVSSMSGLESRNAEMLSELLGLMASEYGLRMVLDSDDEAPERPFVESLVKYAVSYNVGDMLNDMLSGQTTTTSS